MINLIIKSVMLFMVIIISIPFSFANVESHSAIQQYNREFGGGTNNTYVNASITDSKGNTYIVGYTSGGLNHSIGFNKGFSEVNKNGGDGFILKYSKEGKLIKKASYEFGAGVDNAQTNVSAIAIDNQNHVFIVGSTSAVLNSTVSAGKTPVHFNKINNNGIDAFILEYDMNGNFIASGSREFGTDSNNASTTGNAIAVDSKGRFYVGGSTTAPLNTSTGGKANIKINQGTGLDGFIIKYDNNGNFLSSREFGGNGPLDVNTQVTAMKVDQQNNLIVGGITGDVLNNSVTDPQNTVKFKKINYGVEYDGFILKYTFDGTLIQNSSYEFGGNSAIPGDTFVSALEFDPMGNLYVGGNTSTALGLSTGASTSFILHNQNGNDGFILSYNFNGVFNPVMSREFGGSITNGRTEVNTLAIDKLNNLYVGGATSVALDNTTGSTTPFSKINQQSDGFILKYDSYGHLDPAFSHEFGGGGSSNNQYTEVDTILINTITQDLTVSGETSVALNTSVGIKGNFVKINSGNNMDGFTLMYGKNSVTP